MKSAATYNRGLCVGRVINHAWHISALRKLVFRAGPAIVEVTPRCIRHGDGGGSKFSQPVPERQPVAQGMARRIRSSHAAGIFLVACALSACGSGGSSSPAPVEKAPVKPISITQWGDSTTVGYYKQADGTYAIYAGAPVQMLQTALQAQYGSNVTVKLAARGGATVRDMIDGTGSFPQPLTEAIKADTSQIETIRFGLNDEGRYDVATYKANLVEAVQIMQAACKTVVLEELTPNVHWQIDSSRQYADAVDQVAAQFGLQVVKCYSLTLAIPNWTSMLSDDEHPTQPLYQQISDMQLPVLGPIVKSMQ